MLSKYPRDCPTSNQYRIFLGSQIAGLRWDNVGKPFTSCLRLMHMLFYIGLMLAQRLHNIHISHGLEGDIPEYQPRGDTKAVVRYVTRCRRAIHTAINIILFLSY